MKLWLLQRLDGIMAWLDLRSNIFFSADRPRTPILPQLVALLGTVLVFSILIAIFEPNNLDRFLSISNFRLVLLHTVIVGICALGMFFVIMSGGIDLSVGSIIALSAVVCGLVMREATPLISENIALAGGLAVCMATLVGVLCGLLNGIVIGNTPIPAFVMTLGTMQVFRGLAKGLAGETEVRASESWVNNLMSNSPDQAFMFLNTGIWLFFVVVLVSDFVAERSVLGRHSVAVGCNEQTAKLCKIDISRHKLVVYSTCGLAAGISGVMSYSFLGSGVPTTGMAKELDVIAAVVIGGVSLTGGRGNAFAVMIGAILLSLIYNGCLMLNLPHYTQQILIGAIIVGFVLANLSRRY